MGTLMTCNVEVKSVGVGLNVSGDSSEPPDTVTTNEKAWYIRGVLDLLNFVPIHARLD